MIRLADGMHTELWEEHMGFLVNRKDRFIDGLVPP
jgi:hypothetical protein